MPFEVFDKTKAVYSRTPNVTIQPRGLISINQSAFRKMGEPKLIVFMYDREDKRVGIAGTDDDVKGYRVRVATRTGSPAVVSGSAFLNYYEISPSETRRWAPTFEGQTLVLDLKTPGRTVGNQSVSDAEDPTDD